MIQLQTAAKATLIDTCEQTQTEVSLKGFFLVSSKMDNAIQSVWLTARQVQEKSTRELFKGGF